MPDPFDHLMALPGLRRLFDLVWRTFGVNPALVSMDGGRVVIFEKETRAQPFCRALNGTAGGQQLCTMCDQSKFLDARRDALTLRYRCHAGLREFIIPVIRDGQTMAFMQCGQVHDRSPSTADWHAAQKSLRTVGIHGGPLRRLFHDNRVLSLERQDDLLDLLELVAARLAHSHARELSAAPGQRQATLGRAMMYIESNLSEHLSVEQIAHAVNLSRRTLMRLFRNEAGASVIGFILQRRVARARQLLLQNCRTCAEIAFECGFGSVQHFNRIFRRFEKASPTEWRAQRARSAGERDSS
jgi:AraC-like DNA-binding protein